ncbi:hypothetical protein CDG77_08215 [Nostoc sp. 'Peltigera membranacea cyanobiont' 213]|uniref:hypothetical protein n=1 Tax=unclassified Nostoc TaxID=2593658 RepID=UPI000B954CEF|nr:MULTISPECIES: hypothetical protein [unclassified Nostoc]AVH64511.1 hypothetical protein NPM_2867 [Nostoc sp. 'Peltigera membranacea cyanobiont' N6]OYD97060.1 hypothetical protein CDG77_08215 [Nostoc sp. 'Peltigera membranacea cyanobiont' 213]OYE03361.1 hypothetical protein CDG79_18810 [Nostoc sp. 'Peltigera membranacea cyanobiont' 232]
MSAKLKLFLIVILSIFATAGAGVYIIQRQQSVPIVESSDGQTQQVKAIHQSQEVVAYPNRSDYKTIPLEKINSSLQGSDPATLALNAFDDITPVQGTRKVEVAYPQRNQALVTITQLKRGDDSVGIKYRVEMSAFGRSLFISSPPVWQIVWAGSQVECWAGSRSHTKLNHICH